jgi:prepilin-type N-terminal cleavage/methylation domain-containing protein
MSVFGGRTARGFTIVELLTVLTIVGIALAVIVPRFRLSPSQTVAAEARQLARDLEVARTRALATKRSAQVVFDVARNSYTGYLDHDGDGKFLESATEMQALQGRGNVDLSPEVRFGRGSASAAPDDMLSGAVTFPNTRATFGPNGLTTPFGARGTIYIVSNKDPNVVAAVSVTGGGSFKVWRYNKEAKVWQ